MKWVALILLVIFLLPSKAEAGGGDRGCGGYSGRAYVICKESGLENSTVRHQIGKVYADRQTYPKLPCGGGPTSSPV